MNQASMFSDNLIKTMMQKVCQTSEQKDSGDLQAIALSAQNLMMDIFEKLDLSQPITEDSARVAIAQTLKDPSNKQLVKDPNIVNQCRRLGIEL